ncbi:hypothetical protein AB0L33_32280 [Streptomyces sp. NPDC052299]|uniref:hypothetical protein n=1 Tax=Streptomyces sp. NPDC052299 TaxID=3155054 RepID=UPI0034233459
MTAAAAPRVATSQHRYAFALLGSVQITLIFTLAAIAVPLLAIGREFGLERADLILLSAACGLTFAGLLLSGVISALFSWRWAFAVPLVEAVVALALTPRMLLRRPAHARQRRLVPYRSGSCSCSHRPSEPLHQVIHYSGESPK